ncbi:MAG: hypothetical protein HY814_10990 [Candidatus Riflebacteria bacterium]|nr:hypothetical protein [Candidatus Riflebacteria bacterium]
MDSRELEQLVRAIMRGGVRALERLFAGYMTPLLELGHRLGLEDEQAGAVACDVFLRIYRESPAVSLRRRRERGESWLFERFVDEARGRLARRPGVSSATPVAGTTLRAADRSGSLEKRG